MNFPVWIFSINVIKSPVAWGCSDIYLKKSLMENIFRAVFIASSKACLLLLSKKNKMQIFLILSKVVHTFLLSQKQTKRLLLLVFSILLLVYVNVITQQTLWVIVPDGIKANLISTIYNYLWLRENFAKNMFNA